MNTINKIKKTITSSNKSVIEDEIKLITLMNEKIEPLIDNKLIYYIGKKTPRLDKMDTDKIINTFLYYFSFLSCYSLENLDIEMLKKEFKYTISILEKRKNINFTSKQIWWILVFDYIRFLGDRHELFLVIDTTSCLINKIEELNDSEVSKYANILNNCFYNEVGEGLRVRPLLAQDIDSETLNENKLFKFWINKKEGIVEIIKEKLNMRDFNNKLLNRELGLLTKLNIEFDEWDIVFEIFISHIVAVICPDDDMYENIEEEDIEVAVTVTLSKLTRNSKNSKSSIEYLSKELASYMSL